MSAFTLLELLVVVAVIVLLFAILLPGMRRAREIARSASCQSQLSQLAKAWEMYLNVHDGHFYQKVDANVTYGGWTGTTTQDAYRVLRPLNPFVGLPAYVETGEAAKIFRCPDDTARSPDNLTPCYDYYGTSFQTNILLIGQDQVSETGGKWIIPVYRAINAVLRNLTISRVTDPSRLILMGDYGWGCQWISKYSTGVAWHGDPAHYDVAFLDGHVEYVYIRRGLLITPTYRIQPFESLDSLTISSQREER